MTGNCPHPNVENKQEINHQMSRNFGTALHTHTPSVGAMSSERNQNEKNFF